MIETGRRVSAMELGRAMLARTTFHGQVQRFFDRYDLLLTPQMPAGAWPIEGPPSAIGGKPTPAMFDRLPFTFPFNLTGHPAASVPCGFTPDRLPIGLQLTGRRFDEATLLRVADAYERDTEWSTQPPPILSR